MLFILNLASLEEETTYTFSQFYHHRTGIPVFIIVAYVCHESCAKIEKSCQKAVISGTCIVSLTICLPSTDCGIRRVPVPVHIVFIASIDRGVVETGLVLSVRSRRYRDFWRS